MSKTQKKLYNKRAVTWGAFLGGPLVGVYMYSQNWKTLGKEVEAHKHFQLGVVGFIVSFILVMLLPEIISDSISGSIVGAVSFIAFDQLYKIYQAQFVEKAVAKGMTYTTMYDNIRVLIGGVIATLMLSFILSITLYTIVTYGYAFLTRF